MSGPVGRSIKDSDDVNASSNKTLVIEKKACKIYEKNYSPDDEKRGFTNTLSGLLGILNISGHNFVVVITEKQMMGKIEGANIYMIKNADLIPFYDDFQELNKIRNYVDGVKKFLQSGFYFSYNTDLTSNRQRTAKQRNQGLSDGYSIWDTCDKRYFWNYNICQDFLFQKVDPRWIVPVIQGYVEYSSQIFDQKELEILLISRRRFSMAGTRYNARGLDDEGNVANYVETEQILCYRNNIYSFVQIRGSVPLFWQQKGLQAHTSIKRDNELTAQAFDKHLSDMVNDYKLVIFINLLQKARSYEYMLTQALEQLFQMSNPKCVKYTYFDFHTETKGDNFHRLNDLMIKIEDMLVKKFVYFIEDRNTGQIIQEQKGIMRTNCLDCLDRTNVTQTKVALKILENILDRVKAQNRKGFNNNLNGKDQHNSQQLNMLGFDSYNNGDAFVFDIMKNMWAENGDIISKQYAGTSSTITSVTKTGKQGFLGKIDQMRRGVERFLVNNIEDGHKHECIKLFINQHPQQQQYGVRAALEKKLETYFSSFTNWSNITVSVVTWNLAGNTPPLTFDISNIVHHDGGQGSKQPDVYVVGLQEMVKLNAKSVIQGKDRERSLLWEKIITNSLCKRSKYICVSKKPMVGCFVLLFIKDEHKHRINQIRTSKVKTGFGGQSGNKGAVAIRFNFDNSSFAFINCHLSSGQSQTSERLEDLREIYKKSFDCSQKYQDFMIQSHDYKFIFGDLNFRIALPYETAKDEIRKQNYAYLQSKDQLLQVKQSNSILNRFSEGLLNFDPTFKYDDHSNNYDTSQKRRVPSWCDRVLYEKAQKCGGNIELQHYVRKESYFSDHRPVCAIFQIQVCKIDQTKKQQLELRLLDQLFPGTLTQHKKQQEELKALKGQNQFDLKTINIQESYVDTTAKLPNLQKESSSYNGTQAMDALLLNTNNDNNGTANYDHSNDHLTQSEQIDELLKSNLQSSQIVEDLISLGSDQMADLMKSSSDLIDLFGDPQQKPQSQQVQVNQQLQRPAQQQQYPQMQQMVNSQQTQQFGNNFTTNNSNVPSMQNLQGMNMMNMNMNANMIRPPNTLNQQPLLQPQQNYPPQQFQIQNSYIQSFNTNNGSNGLQPQQMNIQAPQLQQKQPQFNNQQQFMNFAQNGSNNGSVLSSNHSSIGHNSSNINGVQQQFMQLNLQNPQNKVPTNNEAGGQLLQELFGQAPQTQINGNGTHLQQTANNPYIKDKQSNDFAFPQQQTNLQQPESENVQDFFQF